MNKRDSIRQRKRQRQAQRKKQRQQHHARMVPSKWPRFVIPHDSVATVPTEFRETVVSCLRSIDFEDTTEFTDNDRTVLRCMKAKGIEAVGELIDQPGERDVVGRATVIVMDRIGGVLYKRMVAAGLYETYGCTCTVFVVPEQNIFVSFKALARRQGPYGTFFTAGPSATVGYMGQEFQLGFSRHAINRIAERATATPASYRDSIYTLGLLIDCTRPDLSTITHRDGGTEPAAVIYMSYTSSSFLAQVGQDVAGIPASDTQPHRLKLGYAPLAFHGSFAIAKTLLVPGMYGTPESELLRRTRLPRDQYQAIVTSLQQSHTFADLIAYRNTTAAKWFHENGIPQVVEMPPQETQSLASVA